MSEEVTQTPIEGETKPEAIDMSKFVAKEEFDKSLSAKGDEVASLQKTLEEAQESLTSPDYLAYLASKKAESERSTEEKPSSGAEAKRIAQLEASVSHMAAILELQQTEARYTDFNDYRSDVQTLINKNGNLSFEQAYLIAKQQKGDVKKPEEPAAKPEPKGTEKPGTFVPDPSLTDKEFKNTTEANADAIKQIKEKYNITGDTI